MLAIDFLPHMWGPLNPVQLLNNCNYRSHVIIGLISATANVTGTKLFHYPCCQDSGTQIHLYLKLHQINCIRRMIPVIKQMTLSSLTSFFVTFHFLNVTLFILCLHCKSTSINIITSRYLHCTTLCLIPVCL